MFICNNFKLRNATDGEFCSFGQNVQIVLGKHPLNFVSTHFTFYAINKPVLTFSDKTCIQEYDYVNIGHQVWIADCVLIPGGVSIGNGAIITARAIVAQDVALYSIVGGVPAKHIKFRFDVQSINNITASMWLE